MNRFIDIMFYSPTIFSIAILFCLIICIGIPFLAYRKTTVLAFQLVSVAFTFILAIIGGISLLYSISLSGELLIVGACLLSIVIFSVITIYLTPSRMTVIAGISIGMIIAVFLVEFFIWLTAYMRARVEAVSYLLDIGITNFT